MIGGEIAVRDLLLITHHARTQPATMLILKFKTAYFTEARWPAPHRAAHTHPSPHRPPAAARASLTHTSRARPAYLQWGQSVVVTGCPPQLGCGSLEK